MKQKKKKELFKDSILTDLITSFNQFNYIKNVWLRKF